MFCGNCGQQIKDSDPFCPSCGTKVVQQPGPLVSNVKPKSTMSKKTKIVIATIIGVLVIFVGSMQIYNSNNTVTKTSEKLKNAISTQDISKINAIVLDDSGLPLSEPAVKAMATYFNKNMKQLDSELNKLKDPDGTQDLKGTLEGNLGSLFLTGQESNIKVEKRSTLGFRHYVFEFPTTSIKVAYEKNMTLEYVGKTETKEPEQGVFDLGNFVKGVPLHVTSKIKTDWGDIENAADIQPSDRIFSIPLQNAMYFNIGTSNLPKANILVNGKDTGVSTRDANTVKVGPMPKGTYTFKVISKEAFGDVTFTASSENAKTTYEGLLLTPDTVANKEILTGIANFLDQYNVDTMSHKNNKDKLVSDGPFAKTYKPLDEKLTYIHISTKVFSKTLEIEEKNGKSIITVTSMYTSGPPESEFYDSYLVYKLQWDDSAKQWRVYDITNASRYATVESPDDIEINHPLSE